MWPFCKKPAKWQYKRIVLRGGPSVDSMNKFSDSKGKEVEELFNELGSEGWELVSITRVHSTTEAEKQSTRECVFKKEA